MIGNVKVREEFETAKQGYVGSRTMGYKIDSLPVGHELDLSSSVVLLVGPNGSGKSTLLEKLHDQISGTHTSFFDEQVRGKTHMVREPRQDDRVSLENKAYQSYRTELDTLKGANGTYGPNTPDWLILDMESHKPNHSNYVRVASTGQFQREYIESAIREAQDELEEGTPVTILFDEPEKGLDPVMQISVLQSIMDYAAQDGAQVLIATHNIGYLSRVPEDARVVNFYNEPATVEKASDFDLDSCVEKAAEKASAPRLRAVLQ